MATPESRKEINEISDEAAPTAASRGTFTPADVGHDGHERLVLDRLQAGIAHCRAGLPVPEGVPHLGRKLRVEGIATMDLDFHDLAIVIGRHEADDTPCLVRGGLDLSIRDTEVCQGRGHHLWVWVAAR